MKHELLVLPYANNALEPIISKTTIDLHHGKHLAGYVNNLNNMIVGTKFENADLVTIVKESDGAIFNNAGQTLNHNLYFTQFAPVSDKTKRKTTKSHRRRLGKFRRIQKRI